MKTRTMALAITLVAGCLATGEAVRAAGFQLQEQSARALAMGNAFTGVADDPATVYWNPAGIARLPGFQLSGSAVALDIHSNHNTDERGAGMHNQRAKNDTQFALAGYGTMSFDLGAVRLGIGGGLWAPYGLSLHWATDNPQWGGRFSNEKASIAVIEGNLSAAIEFEASEMFAIAIAGGASIIGGQLELQRKVFINNPNEEPTVKLNLATKHPNWRWNAAILVRLLDNTIRIGAAYRDNIHDLTVEGKAKIRDNSGLFTVPRGDARLTARLPGEFRVGIAVDPIEQLTLAFDWRFTNWSVMKSFDLKAEEPLLVGNELVFEWRDSNTYMVGAEYRLMDFEDDGFGLALRLGGGWDETPIPTDVKTPVLPDGNRFFFGVGFGIQVFENMTVDFAYFGVNATKAHIKRTIDAETPTIGAGRYRTYANIFSIGGTLKF